MLSAFLIPNLRNSAALKDPQTHLPARISFVLYSLRRRNCCRGLGSLESLPLAILRTLPLDWTSNLCLNYSQQPIESKLTIYNPWPYRTVFGLIKINRVIGALLPVSRFSLSARVLRACVWRVCVCGFVLSSLLSQFWPTWFEEIRSAMLVQGILEDVTLEHPACKSCLLGFRLGFTFVVLALSLIHISEPTRPY